MSSPPDATSSADLPARQQCLLNVDLLEEILGHIPSRSNGKNLKAERQTLMWIASACRAMSPSAIKFLWRRLDNLLPLLRLLPAFIARDGVYAFWGPLNTHASASFDRHAAHVKEIIYEDIPTGYIIDPSVYLQLFLRSSTVLPNLERFVCTTAQPSAAEIMLYMKSPLRTLQLGSIGTHMSDTKSAITTGMILSSLSTNQSHLSSLILVNLPFHLLSEGIPPESLTSLEIRAMEGHMDHQLLRRIGSLPHLRALTTDPYYFAGSDPGIMGSALFRAEQDSRGSLFMKLTHLRLEGKPNTEFPPITLFGSILEFIGTNELQSLILGLSYRTRLSQEGAARGSLALLIANIDEARDPLHILVRRWSQSLRQLELNVDGNQTAVVTLLGRLSALRNLKLSGSVDGLLPSAVFCSAFARLADLETLSFYSRWGSNRHLLFNIPFIARLAALCPKLREVDIAFSGSNLPSSSTLTVSHNLRIIIVHISDTIANTVTVARHLDRLFPRLNTVRYENHAVGGGSKLKTAWAQVQELVFAFQDVRRDALSSVRLQ
ncbi:hypothetical protein B0H19DRAFT_1373460 [Mycena capillaripes]|nr:hypothetical protein B0H19DRAFT_1373460 [Mycena capillaripes]